MLRKLSDWLWSPGNVHYALRDTYAALQVSEWQRIRRELERCVREAYARGSFDA